MSTLGDLQYLADPYPELERLREAGPVRRIRRRDGLRDGWLITRYDDVLAALADPRLSSDPRHAAQPLGPRGGPQNRDLVASDPPDHTRLRKVVAAAFTPRRIHAIRPRVQELADHLLTTARQAAATVPPATRTPAAPRADATMPPATETFAGPRADATPAASVTPRADAASGAYGVLDADVGRVDVVGEFAYPLTVGVICELLGLPGGSELEKWAGTLTTPAGDEASVVAREQAWAAICGHFAAAVDRKRAEPGEDMLTVLAAAYEAGELTRTELISTGVLLFISGFQSPVSLIANGALLILERPELRDRLRADPALLEPVIEEIIRYDGPVAFGPYRYATEPVTIGGVTIPEGETVYLGYGTANRDPRRFDRPDVLDPARTDNAHLGFGRGVHRCVGPQLARLEAGIALGTLLRLPDLALAVPRTELTWRGSANRAVPEFLYVTTRR